MGRVIIAFSGGVDSSLLLKVAHDVLGKDVLAVTVLSPTTPEMERRDAVRFARGLGVTHIFLKSGELDFPDFAENTLKRCYICKKHRFSALAALAEKHKIPFILDGTNRDDHKDFRPGIQATLELGVRSPLSEAGFTKEEIRKLSKKLKLSTWDKPSLACLASRIPYGRTISARELKQVDAAENYIRKFLTKGQVRVRHEGETARIEVAGEDISRIADPEVRRRAHDYFKRLGFRFVALDLGGYRMGGLNPKKKTAPNRR